MGSYFWCYELELMILKHETILITYNYAFANYAYKKYKPNDTV